MKISEKENPALNGSRIRKQKTSHRHLRHMCNSSCPSHSAVRIGECDFKNIHMNPKLRAQVTFFWEFCGLGATRLGGVGWPGLGLGS